MKTLILIIILLVLLKIIVLILGKFYSDTSWYTPLKLFVAMSKFECMAIGGAGAYLLFSKNKFLDFLYNKYILLSSIVLIPLLIFITPEALQDGIHIVYSVLFLIIILNISNNSMSKIFENKTLNYLGKISYGIYMYHFMIIPFVLYVLKNTINISSELASNSLIYGLSISLTILISGLSYRFFELPFIKLKSRHAIIKSGSE